MMSTGDFSDELFTSMTSAVGQIPASPQLRDSLLCQTTRTIRTRRRVRRVGIAAALVGCYLGGIATMSLWPVAGDAATATEVAAQKVVRPEDDQFAIDGVPRLTPYDRLRRAGDQQLEKYANIPAATRSYQKALQLASDEQRVIAPDRDSCYLWR
jgi:hypothetical protein